MASFESSQQTCPHCQAVLPSAAVPRPLCPLCGKPLPNAADRTGSQYYYARDNRVFGPVSSAQLRDLARAGQLFPTDMIRRTDSNKWAAASKVKHLFPESAPPAATSAKPNRPATVPPAPPPEKAKPARPESAAKAQQPVPDKNRSGCGEPAASVEPAVPCAVDEVKSLVPCVSRQHVLSEAVVVPDSIRCVQCGCCTFNCPIGIDVRAHAWRGIAIEDSHCLTCSECVRRCPRGVLSFEVLPVFGH
ncbi:MAG: GYF domain-containing protein [Gemmataceae bacterium]